MTDKSFNPDKADLYQAMDWLLQSWPSESDSSESDPLSDDLPESGLGELATMDSLAPLVLGGAARLGSPFAFAHMDPPTPWITWVMQCWNASLNQNLLHLDVSPVASQIEARVLNWLTPYFGMSGGHLTPGSTVSNLTALWAARDTMGVTRVIASSEAHLSVAKAAHILGLDLISIPANSTGQLNESLLPDDLSDTALVLTAGTTTTGAIDAFSLIGKAAWTHIDAAWAGPLRFSHQYAQRLAGIELADSVSVSAHKWLYQPKECGVLMFRDTSSANEALSISGPYLSKPNVGLLGSHGASAIPLLATLLAWGRAGLAARIDAAMSNADVLIEFLEQHKGIDIFGENVSGVVLWKASQLNSDLLVKDLPTGAASLATLDSQRWIRHISANPNIQIPILISAIRKATVSVT